MNKQFCLIYIVSRKDVSWAVFRKWLVKWSMCNIKFCKKIFRKDFDYDVNTYLLDTAGCQKVVVKNVWVVLSVSIPHFASN